LTRYITLSEYFWLAEQVTGVDAGTLSKVSRMELSDSALHAAQASFGGEEFYPDVLDKAAVLTCRLAWNHAQMNVGRHVASVRCHLRTARPPPASAALRQ
jgi:prophage maintenance system killer protein